MQNVHRWGVMARARLQTAAKDTWNGSWTKTHGVSLGHIRHDNHFNSTLPYFWWFSKNEICEQSSGRYITGGEIRTEMKQQKKWVLLANAGIRVAIFTFEMVGSSTLWCI